MRLSGCQVIRFCQTAPVVLRRKQRAGWLWVLLSLTLSQAPCGFASQSADKSTAIFPPPLSTYQEPEGSSVAAVLKARAKAEPLNVVATAIFALAIIHTFLTPMFMRLAHRLEKEHHEQLARLGRLPSAGGKGEVSFWAEVCHFLGEVEAIFGIWVIPLLIVIAVSKGWPVARAYLGHDLNFTEPLFVVVIMTIAASRPILTLAEQVMAVFAKIGKGSPAAWWLSILTIGPLLGSFITEPAAMTISALLLTERFYEKGPGPAFSYATLGLLFVNVSVGGLLTHFAAPPVLMVADTWGWGARHMLTHFGWKAAAGIVAANLLYGIWFREQLRRLGWVDERRPKTQADSAEESVPVWVTAVHIFFLVWTVMNNHDPALFVGGFLFYLAFIRATGHHQSELSLEPALLVGFFLAGLVVHGGLQGWWIQPVLGSLSEMPLFAGAAALTAFNDNAAITYLASLVPGFSPTLQYAVVAGAVAAGGLTVIANAPNPAGQSILGKFFPDGVSPVGLFLGALAPTLIMAAIFMLVR